MKTIKHYILETNLLQTISVQCFSCIDFIWAACQIDLPPPKQIFLYLAVYFPHQRFLLYRSTNVVQKENAYGQQKRIICSCSIVILKWWNATYIIINPSRRFTDVVHSAEHGWMLCFKFLFPEDCFTFHAISIRNVTSCNWQRFTKLWVYILKLTHSHQSDNIRRCLQLP